jgi:ribonucleotide monophosphatase NagD (HAD superfamily)
LSSDKVPLASAGHLLDRYAAFAIDLDGVVWRGARILEGAVDGLNAVRSTGKPLALMTNNGSYLPDVIVARLSEAGFDVRKS